MPIEPDTADRADKPDPVAVQRVERDAFFLLTRPTTPEIPADQQRECPQCRKAAWAQSRWCWNCKFDFDRAACARFHPAKLLFFSLLANALLAAILLWLAVTRAS